ncbi:MAG: acyl carrier protein [Candidatus Omnitrophota bacterium]
MPIDQEVKETIARTLTVNPEEIAADKKLYDSLSVDSTEIVDLRAALEKKFAVKIAANELTKFSTPREIVTLINNKQEAGR